MNPAVNGPPDALSSGAKQMPESAGSLEDPRVARALEEYRMALEAGDKPDRARLLAAHPEIASVLADCLDGLEFVHGAAPALSQPDNAPAIGAAELLSATPLGDFRIVREVGRGGMGVVYEAEQLSLGRRVALKVLPFAAALDTKQLQRFKNEAQAAAHLQHPHIVPVHYVGCERGVHFYAMQFIDGQTLAALIAELRRPVQPPMPEPPGAVSTVSALAEDLASGRWAPAPTSGLTITPPVAALSTERSTTSPAFFRTVASLGVQAAEALEHAHQLGVIHRDIKPANLLVDATGQLWVTDFGLARLGTEAGLTMTGELLGTLRYMSPEQALAQRGAVDARTDVYSLGITLYELLALEPAYDGRSREEVLRQIAFEEPRPPRRLNQAIPAELETIVLKAMAKSPDERYATAQALADDLRRFLEDQPIHARRPTLRQRARKWARRHQSLVVAAVVFLALLLVLTAAGASIGAVLIWKEKAQTKEAYEAETRAKDDLRTNLYFKNVALAEREAAVNNLGRMQQLLEQCPDDLRGWEWHYLQGLGRRHLPPLRHEAEILSTAYSPTGQWFASGTTKGVITIWDARTRELISTFFGGDGHVPVLAFSPDGRRLAGTRHDGFVKVWDVPSGRELLAWPAHRGKAINVTFSPDGSRVLSAGTTESAGEVEDFQVKVWDAASGRLLQTLPPLSRRLLRIAFSPDGRYVAGSEGRGGNNAVRVWDAQTGRQLLSLGGHTGRVLAMAFSGMATSSPRRAATGAGGPTAK
jgi:serine/threonine protein kinase